MFLALRGICIGNWKGRRNGGNYLGRFRKCAEIEKGDEIINRNEFIEERDTGLEAWHIAANNHENPVGDYDKVDNHELKEDKQEHYDIEENQLENPQYKLRQRDGGNSKHVRNS